MSERTIKVNDMIITVDEENRVSKLQCGEFESVQNDPKHMPVLVKEKGDE